MLSTIHRRYILGSLEREKTTSLRSLKTLYVDTGEMNQTTLYRIMDRFIEEGLLHRADFAGEKYFTLCHSQKKDDEAVILKCCVNCHNIEDKHASLAPESLSSETIEIVKHCKKCVKLFN